MAWSEPQYGRSVVNGASKIWLNPETSSNDKEAALLVINNWRASHSFPLNTFQMGLRRRAKKVDDDVIVAQRIKRLSSIELKLRIRPTMKLTQMQDIGGCRAILRSVAGVRKVVESFLKSDIKHKLLTQDDYISAPRESGYRGVHVVYSYFSDRKETYNDLKIELQIRSQLQHAWATSVEVVGTMIGQALKSSLGEEDWLRFFQLMSSEIARTEKCPIVTGTPDDVPETRKEIAEFVKLHNPINRLDWYRSALQFVDDQTTDKHFYILHLKPRENLLNVTSFKRDESEDAADRYLEIEETIEQDTGEEAVLVSVDSIGSLKKAYPNYFLDTQLFTKQIEKSLKSD